ncbi:MAG TPA: MXAN_5187 C-terminal domain-containing protein [bacterium]|nr:MXAN_5187 C-terminal domain-containing protein [bacterium]
MLGNVWLKIKVFFFISSVLAFLSFLFFNLFDHLVTRINFQQGADNTFRYLEQRIKNHQYELITRSFEISSKLKVTADKKTKQVVFDTQGIDPNLLFAFLDGNGSLVTGSFRIFNSMVGVPAVDRAIRDGIASDGMLKTETERYLIGVAPFNVDLGLDRPKRMIAVTLVPIREALSGVSVTFPAQVYTDNTLLYEFNKESLLKINSGEKQAEIQKAVEDILAGNAPRTIDRWLHISSFSLPSDIRSAGGRTTFVGFMSALPGYEVYNKSVTYIGLYALAAIIITLIFTILITYDVDRGFKKLAADISRLRIGEKLVLHKYSHGAGIVVSSLNHLIGNYQKHTESVGHGSSLSALVPEIKDEEVEIPEPSFDKKRESAPVTDTSKTVRTGGTDPRIAQPVDNADPYAALWETYRGIKEKNGEKATDQERISFLAKLKTNRVSIMSKYNCRDVSFVIEEKEGKPVIKAKPVK